MKDTKKVIPLFDFYDKTSIENYLEKQAAKGWLIEKMSQVIWRFKRIKPMRVHFSVTYFPKASVFDAEPGEGQLEYQEFCEHTGWVFAASDAQMQVFYSTEEEPRPIETDVVMEIENIHKSVMKNHPAMWGTWLFNGLMQMCLFVINIAYHPIAILCSNIYLMIGLCWILEMCFVIADMITYFNWRRRAKRIAKTTGEFLKTARNNFFMPSAMIVTFVGLGLIIVGIGGKSMVGCVVAIIIGILAIARLVLMISQFMKAMKVSANINRGVTIIAVCVLSIGALFIMGDGLFNAMTAAKNKEKEYDTYEYIGRTWKAYKDEIPLCVKDLKDTDYNQYSTECDTDESVLAVYMEASDKPRVDALSEPDIEYTVVDVNVPVAYDWIMGVMIKEIRLAYGVNKPSQPDYVRVEKSNAHAWKADRAYEFIVDDRERNSYILCYDNRIVHIEFGANWKPTISQKAKVAEVLGK